MGYSAFPRNWSMDCGIFSNPNKAKLSVINAGWKGEHACLAKTSRLRLRPPHSFAKIGPARVSAPDPGRDLSGDRLTFLFRLDLSSPGPGSRRSSANRKSSCETPVRGFKLNPLPCQTEIKTGISLPPFPGSRSDRNQPITWLRFSELTPADENSQEKSSV